MSSADLEQLRRTIVVAFATDDDLAETLVFKGGNALTLVHNIGDRASKDLDYSIETEFESPSAVQEKMRGALVREFAKQDRVVFDVSLVQKPDLRGKEDRDPTWGGYRLSFKIADKEVFERFAAKPEKQRSSALRVYGPKTTFPIDISKFEYCDAATETIFEGYDIRVYPAPMIAAEKLRALCQQMESYTRNQGSKSPRSRDLYDICSIVDSGCN